MKLLSGVLLAAVNSQQVCNDLGDSSVRCDPGCAGGGLGCNAGGQGELCRFCDFDPYRPCGDLSHCCDTCCDDWCTTPETSTTTTRGDGTTTTTTTTTRTTKPTTKPTAKPTLPPGLPEECYDYGDGIIDPDYEASPGELVFVENWDTFNMDIWEHEITMGGGGNWEFQTYNNNRTNTYVRDNVLYIKPTLLADRQGEDFLKTGHQDLWGAQPSDQCTGNAWWGCDRVGTPTNIINPIDSGRIRTSKSFNIQNARIEIDAKLPRGDWLWPAIWMLPKHLSYGKWPASGEIDIMESRGNDKIWNPKDNEDVGNNCFGSTLHWGPYFPANGFPKTHESVCLTNGRSFADEWHTYTLDWTTEYIAFELDGEEFFRVPKPEGGFWQLGEFEQDFPGSENPWTEGTQMAPFDTEFHLIFNLAVGGANEYWSDDLQYENRKPWLTTSPQAMLDFWNDRANWEKTWNGEDSALQIGKIKIWKRGDGSEDLQQTFKPKARRQLKNKGTKMVNVKKADDAIVPKDLRQPGDLIFHEPFDKLNMDIWEHEMTMNGGGNWEFQVYYNNRTNSYVKDSTLYIQPSLTADILGEAALSSERLDLWGASPSDECTGNAWWGCERVGSGSNYLPPAYSARLRTVNSFTCKYCRVEVEAKLPKGDWIWPAIWMLPKNLPYGKWPASGEIDIMESRGNVNLKHNGHDIGVECYGATLHWGPFWPFNGYEKTSQDHCLSSGTFNDDFHTFTVDWQRDHMSFELDGNEILRIDPGQDGFWGLGDFEKDAPGIENPWEGSDEYLTPFDTEFYLILNVAIGGTNGFFPDDAVNGGGPPKPWNNESPTAMKDFWMAKDQWLPTWVPEDSAMQIRDIKVWQN